MPPKTQTQLLKHVSRAATRYCNSTPLHAAPEFLQLNLSCFHVSVMCFPICIYTRDDMKHLAADKECCTRRSKVEWDDGKSFIISCFYIAALFPVQSSMHELEGPNVWLLPPQQAGIPRLSGMSLSC